MNLTVFHILLYLAVLSLSNFCDGSNISKKSYRHYTRPMVFSVSYTCSRPCCWEWNLFSLIDYTNWTSQCSTFYFYLHKNVKNNQKSFTKWFIRLILRNSPTNCEHYVVNYQISWSMVSDVTFRATGMINKR